MSLTGTGLYGLDDSSASMTQLSQKAVWWQRGYKASIVSLIVGAGAVVAGMALIGIFIAVVINNPEMSNNFRNIMVDGIGKQIVTAGIGIILSGAALFSAGAVLKLLLGSQQPA